MLRRGKFAGYLLILVYAVLSGPATEAGAADGVGAIERIRHASGSDYTRIVIDVSRAVRYRYATVPATASSPARFYIDLFGVKVKPGRDLGTSIGDGRVVGVRAAQFDPGRARVVVDLASAVKAKVFVLTSPPRIVVDLRAMESPARPRRPFRIVLDPGHGGRDPGTRGHGGYAEKAAAFDITRRLAGKLRARDGAEVFVTREGDGFISLEARKDMANQRDADLFVSIHANGSKNSRLHGIETYYLQNTNNRATLRLAKLENGVDMLIKGNDVSTDADLSYILSDMVQGRKEAESARLAAIVQKSLVAHLSAHYRSVTSLGVKQGPFMVLDGTYMPAVLVETGFMTHEMEGRRLATAAYREAVAEGLYVGINRYLAVESSSLR